jgi:hypothetical protein
MTARFSPSEIAAAAREARANGVAVEEVLREVGNA